MAFVAGFPDTFYITRPSPYTCDVAELVIACTGRYVSISRALAAQKSRFKRTVFCLSTVFSKMAGRIEEATESMDVMTKNQVRELVDKNDAICSPCQKVLREALSSDATLLVVMPSVLSSTASLQIGTTLAAFALVLVSVEKDTALVAFSWDATALCHLNVPAIMSVYGALCEAQAGVFLAKLDTTVDANAKIAMRFGTALHAAAMSMRVKKGAGGGFYVAEKMTFLGKMPDRMLTHETEFYVMACADFETTQYLCDMEDHSGMVTIVQGGPAFAESAWIETIREPGVSVQMKRNAVVVNDKGGVKRHRVMSAIIARVQTFQNVASPGLLRVVVDAVVGDAFGHNLVEARLMIYLLYYIARVILAGDMANPIALGSSHLVDHAAALYRRLEAESPIKKAIDAAAMSVAEDLRSAFASFSCAELFTFVHSGSIERAQFTSLMNELIRQNGDVWRACGLLVVSADGTLPLYKDKMCCSFCNTEAADGSPCSFIPCFNPCCESVKGTSRGAICRECFHLYGHPLCLDCATSNTRPSDMQHFYEFMSTCKELVANAAANVLRSAQTDESLRLAMRREQIEKRLLAAELKGSEVDLCANELLLDVAGGAPKPPSKAKKKSKKGNSKDKLVTALSEMTTVQDVAASEVSHAVEGSDASEASVVLEIASLRTNAQRLEAELNNLRRESEARDKLHAREMCAAEQKIAELKKGLRQAESNVAEMVEGAAKGLVFESALRSKLDERTRQFDVMSLVAKQTRTKQAEAVPLVEIKLAKAEGRLEERDARILSLEAEQGRMHSVLASLVGSSHRLVEQSNTISCELKAMTTANLFRLSLTGSKIIQQIEHYFSFFEVDGYLKSLADPSGWVRISELVKFDRLVQLHAHTHDIEQLMSESIVVAVKPGHLRRRH